MKTLADGLQAIIELGTMQRIGVPERKWHEVNHPDFRFVSIPNYQYGIHGTPDGSEVEVAFLDANEEFYTNPVEGFEEYHDEQVYNYVPRTLIDAFLAKYEVTS
jgi:hypothetical protein